MHFTFTFTDLKGGLGTKNETTKYRQWLYGFLSKEASLCLLTFETYSPCLLTFC
jgi:hypothetical protein